MMGISNEKQRELRAIEGSSRRRKDVMEEENAALKEELETTKRAFVARYEELLAAQHRIKQLCELVPQRISNGFVSFGKHYAEQEDKFADPFNAMSKFKKMYLAQCEEALALSDSTAELDTAMEDAERYRKVRKITEGIEHRHSLRGFFIPEDIRDLLAAMKEQGK